MMDMTAQTAPPHRSGSVGVTCEGGKLLLAHGWSDPALSARPTIEYSSEVPRRTPHADCFTRLFLTPGVLHCGGRSGCDDVDFAGGIRRWVEQGEAPSRIMRASPTGRR